MEFVLNLNLEYNRTYKDLNRNNLKDCITLTSESRALLCLTDYCQLVASKDFKCNCFYSKEDIITKLSLKQEFFQRIDFNDILVNKYKEINVEFHELSEYNEPLLKDTNLPCLKRNVSKECSITITGLTSLFRDIIKIGHRLRPSLNLLELLGWRENCVKACAEASKWTHLCEVLSVNVYENLNEINAKELLSDYFKKIQETRLSARNPMSVHNQNKKTILTKVNPRYLEDYQIQISDLIVFYYVTLCLNKVKNWHKSDLESQFSIVCEWYNNMKLDEKVQKYFLKHTKPGEEFKVKETNDEVNLKKEAKTDKVNQEECLEGKYLVLDFTKLFYLNSFKSHKVYFVFFLVSSFKLGI